MRHLVSLAIAVLLLLGAGAVLDRLALASNGPGQVWVLAPGGAMPRVLSSGDLRLLDAWGGGRLLALHADRVAAIHLSKGSAWLTWRLPPSAVVLAGCG